MKSIMPWMCLCLMTAGQQAVAAQAIKDYRLGDYSQAALPMIKQAETDPVANYYLGRMFLYGYGQLQNHDLAMRYFDTAANKGYLPAVLVMAKYALMHDKNAEAAVNWFKKAAAANDVSAQLFLAAAYQFGLGVKKNEDVATKYHIDAARNGNATAQLALAEHFLNSRHSSNYKLGLIWLSKAATGGNIKAITLLGRIYCDGKTRDHGFDDGIALLEGAAQKNHAPAMRALGDIYLKQKNYTQAVEWYQKAIALKDSEARVQLAKAYLLSDTPISNPAEGFQLMTQAAADNQVAAMRELSELYKKGIGTAANEALSVEWAQKAKALEKQPPKVEPAVLAALWLSNDQTRDLDKTSYQMGGIFSAWTNKTALRNNIYNQPPVMPAVDRHELFKPNFSQVLPNEVPIHFYYDALSNTREAFQANQWTYPLYPLNPFVEAEEQATSFVMRHETTPTPLKNAYVLNEQDVQEVGLFDLWTLDWQRRANFSAVFSALYFKAVLGDAQAQFEIGQMFQYGIGVDKNLDSAIIFYENAAAQEHLGAEYQLGILHLNHAQDKAEYQQAIKWLTDAAFKGNRSAQYALSRELADSRKGPDGNPMNPVDKSQAMAMLYLSAANDFGPAEYDLAQHMASQFDAGWSVEVKQQKLALIRQLYEGAARNGVSQAMVPLAFYNAMDEDKTRQHEAFEVAEQAADNGEPRAAILLGLLYDRGIGTEADPQKAMYWYQHAGVNPVSQFILGTYTYEGKGVAKNEETGRDMLLQAANANFSYANFNLAALDQKAGKDFLPALIKAYQMGNGHAGIVLADYYLSQADNEKNMQIARDIFKKLADKGDADAQLKLAFMLEHGLGTTPDMAEAEHWYSESALQGNAKAQFLLGQFYQLGQLGQPDVALALQWYEKAAKTMPEADVARGFIYETVDDDYASAQEAYQKAADRKNADAIYNLGLIYEYGKGLPVDYKQAKAKYNQAADSGSAAAMNQLAGIYFYGLGEARDVEQGLSWYRKAADLGNSSAMYQLGLFSETGVATKIDFNNALSFYTKAAEKGNEKAMLALARMYLYGTGVTKDVQQAVVWYERLADLQNAYAQYKLGTLLMDGAMGEKAPDKGRVYLERASKNGCDQAKKALQKLEAQTQPKVSYLEPAPAHVALAQTGQPADLMYFEALSEWNRGDEALSKVLLKRLVTEHPQYVPAKRVYEQLNQVRLNTKYS